MHREKELLTLAKRVQEVRKERGLSQSQLAHKINKDRESISRFERGKMNPTYLYLKEICAGLDIELKELLEKL